MSGKKYEYSTKYKLIGVCSKLSLIGNSCHYIAFCLCDDNNYYYFNDEEVEKVELNKNNLINNNCFCKGTPYILFYKRFEKPIENIIDIFKKYLEDMVRDINKKENLIKRKKNENMIKYIITSKDEKNEFDFEINFTSVDLNINIYIKEIKNKKNIEYKWNLLKSIKENIEQLENLIKNTFANFNFKFFISFKPYY